MSLERIPNESPKRIPVFTEGDNYQGLPSSWVTQEDANYMLVMGQAKWVNNRQISLKCHKQKNELWKTADSLRMSAELGMRAVEGDPYALAAVNAYA